MKKLMNLAASLPLLGLHLLTRNDSCFPVSGASNLLLSSFVGTENSDLAPNYELNPFIPLLVGTENSGFATNVFTIPTTDVFTISKFYSLLASFLGAENSDDV